MAKKLKKGDSVKWETSQGTTSGKVVRKLTSDTHVKTHKVTASADDPQYLVQSDKTGKQAAHKPDSLKKS